jgi:circadian clock protein KaiC
VDTAAPIRTIAATGIEGLDRVLKGGYSRNCLLLIEGEPGAGKTTLAVQFLLEGVRQGETVLYFTLSESQQEIEAIATSHGWSLEGMQICELMPSQAELQAEHQYTLFHPSEIELVESVQRILAEVEAVDPQRVVFDSLSELRLIAGSSLRYRRQVLTLKRFFSGRQCTVLFLDDLTSTERDLQLQSIADGVVKLEQLHPEYGAERRRLKVIKYRGKDYHGGYHDFAIRRGGIDVFERLVALEYPNGNERAQRPLSTGISAIDVLMGGGIERASSTLISGASGCGKSSLATQIVASAAAQGIAGAIFVFDENPHLLLTRASGMGIDLARHLESGMVSLRSVDPAELSPGEFTHIVRQEAERKPGGVIVVDSLNGYLHAMPEERFLTLQLHELLTFLASRGIASILVAVQHGIGAGTVMAPLDISYLADAVVWIRAFEAQGEMKQAISVLKKRSGNHERTIREFKMTSEGIRVGEPLREFQGIFTGVPFEIPERGHRRESSD